MKEVCGRIYEGSRQVFISQATLGEPDTLVLSFEGMIRVDDSAKLLSGYVKELDQWLADNSVDNAMIDFTGLQFCNSTGFYAVMDILEVLYRRLPGRVTIRRITDDDWQAETLPLLLQALGAEVPGRTEFQEVAAV